MTDSRIKEKILRDAKADAERILQEAKDRAGEIVQQSKKRVEEIRAETEAIARETKQKEIERRLSAARMQSRRALLQEKRTVIDTVFAEAKKELLNLKTAAYVRFIAGIAKDEMTAGNPVLVLSKDDIKKHGKNIGKEILKTSGAGDGIQVATGDFDGGCIVKHKTYEFNATLDTILSRIKERLESELQKVLFG